jgi:hypothetical protein
VLTDLATGNSGVHGWASVFSPDADCSALLILPTQVKRSRLGQHPGMSHGALCACLPTSHVRLEPRRARATKAVAVGIDLREQVVGLLLDGLDRVSARGSPRRSRSPSAPCRRFRSCRRVCRCCYSERARSHVRRPCRRRRPCRPCGRRPHCPRPWCQSPPAAFQADRSFRRGCHPPGSENLR